MKVGFFALYGFHVPILNPIYQQVKLEKLFTRDKDELNAWKPDVVVLADIAYHLIEGNPIIIQVTHSRISKRNTYHRDHGKADYICICSDYDEKEYQLRKAIPKRGFWRTGYAPADPLFRKEITITKESLGFDEHKTIIYAPTWNPELNSVDFFSSDLVQTIRDIYPFNIIIHPHPAIQHNLGTAAQGHRERWRSWFRDMATRDRVCYLEKDCPDSTPYMSISDIMISDISGVVFQFAILNRPILLYNPPTENLKGFYYEPQGTEWKFRDIGLLFSDKNSFKRQLRSALAEGKERDGIRKKYTDILFGEFQDGNAATRIAQNINNLGGITITINEQPKKKDQIIPPSIKKLDKTPRISIIGVTHNQAKLAERGIYAWLHQTIKEPYEIIVLDDLSHDQTESMFKKMVSEYRPKLRYIRLLRKKHGDPDLSCAIPMNIGARLARGEFVCFTWFDRINLFTTLEDLFSPHAQGRNKIVTSISQMRHIATSSSMETINDKRLERLLNSVDWRNDPTKLLQIAGPIGAHCQEPNMAESSCFMLKKKDFIEMSGYDERYISACSHCNLEIWKRFKKIGLQRVLVPACDFHQPHLANRDRGQYVVERDVFDDSKPIRNMVDGQVKFAEISYKEY